MGFRNAPIPAPHPTPYKEDEMLAQLKQALIDNQDNLYLSKQDTAPVSITGARSAVIPEEIPAVDDYGNSISQATVQQSEEANLEKLRRALAGQFDNQQKILEGDVGAQRAYLDSVRGQPVTVNENATLAGLFRTAGVSPQDYAAQLAAATPETPQERQDRLRKALSDVVGGQDKLADNLRASLDAQFKVMDRGKESRQARNLISSKFDKARNDSVKVQKDVDEFSRQASAIEQGLTPNADGRINAGKLKSIIGNYARLVGAEKGVLTDPDIERQLRETFEMKWEALKADISGRRDNETVPPETVKNMQELYIAAANTFKRLQDRRVSNLKESYLIDPAVGSDPTFQSAINKLYDTTGKSGFTPSDFKPKGAAKTYTDEELMNMSDEEFAAYEASLQGKK